MGDIFALEERRAWEANTRAQHIARTEWDTTVVLEGRNPSAAFKADLRAYMATAERDRPDWLVRWFKQRMERLRETVSKLGVGEDRLMVQEELERLEELWSHR